MMQVAGELKTISKDLSVAVLVGRPTLNFYCVLWLMRSHL